MLQPPPLDLIESAWRPFLDIFVHRANVLLQWVPGLTFTSWWRSPAGNRDEGGDRESQHLFALAADFTGSQDRLRLAIWLGRSVGLIMVPSAGHVHSQLFPKGALARAGVVFPE